MAVNSFILSFTLAVFQPVKAFEGLQETVTITPVSQFSDVDTAYKWGWERVADYASPFSESNWSFGSINARES
ncbi:hypothetical protein [Nostoc sp. FACHB-888]|uniref:hypothetical protein n=1 Tax=Nostoc sp. FACHB-888 TaxID=2692842 RepID=UPI0016875E63|nr:hypothetical protein [Nostoc sp. FACHB-888]MBD2248846.1 hypothetical protein [Nostoc sp. FACHB-888]